MNMNFRYKSKEKYDDVDVVLRVLQQLYVTFLNKDGLPTVSTCEYQARKFKQSNKNQLYFVRCDIQDAFGSILQGIISFFPHLKSIRYMLYFTFQKNYLILSKNIL